MATITLDTVWLNDAADLTSFCALENVTDISPSPEVDGEIRTYAGGRERNVSGAGRRNVVAVSATHAARADVLWMEAHCGRLLLFRDPLGRKFYGIYRDLKVTERKGQNCADVTFTIREVTHSEVVTGADQAASVASAAAATVTATSAYDAMVLADSPRAYLALDGQQATDLTGLGHGGTLHGAIGSTTIAGTSDTAAVFDGVSSYIEVADANDLSVPTTGILTIEAWIRPDILQFPNQEGSGYVYWLGKGESSQQEWACRMYSQTNSETRPNRISGYAFNLAGGLGTGSYFQDAVNVGDWVHYTLVINTVNTSTSYPHGYTKLFKNGVQRDQDDLFATASVVPAAGSAPLRIGTREFASYFKGAIGKVAVYDYEVPQSRLLAHARALVPPPGAGTGSFVKVVGVAQTEAASSTMQMTVAGVVPVGNTLVVKVAQDFTSGAPTIADTRGNTYTRQRTAATGGSTMRASIYTAPVTTALQPGDTITVTMSVGTVASKCVVVEEYTGLLSPLTLDGQNGATGTSTTPQLAAAGITTTAANDVLIGMVAVKGPDTDAFADDTTVDLYNPTARVGTNNGGTDNTNVSIAGAYRSVSAAQLYNYKPTLGTSREWVLFLIALRAA